MPAPITAIVARAGGAGGAPRGLLVVDPRDLARRPEMGSLRIAAMANAIEKVARSYLSLGVFP